MTKEILTQSKLKKLLLYHPEIGIFTWLTNRNNMAKRGDIAGCAGAGCYRFISVVGCRYAEHHLAWLYTHGEFPKNEIDHINGNPLDNRICNLRDVTKEENAKNKRMYKNNTSGTSGVYWNKISKKWFATIPHQSKQIYLGTFVDIDSAIKARKLAEVKYGYHENHGSRLTRLSC